MINRGKRSKILNGVKPVQNISKNPQIFLEISPIQKESHKLEFLHINWKTVNMITRLLLE